MATQDEVKAAEKIALQCLQLKEQNAALCHAIQTGVKFDMQFSEELDFRCASVEPKHLRTGVNIAMCELGAIARLLMEKSVITEVEYWTAINKALSEEVDRYQHNLSVKIGRKVTIA